MCIPEGVDISLAVLILACDSSSLAFHMIYSARNLKSGVTIYILVVLFVVLPVLNQFIVPYLVQTVASWLTYKFLRSRSVIWCSHIFKNFPQFIVIHTVKGLSVVNEAEVDAFLESPYFLYDPMNVVNLISGSSAFSKFNLCIWKFSVHVLLKPSLTNF